MLMMSTTDVDDGSVWICADVDDVEHSVDIADVDDGTNVDDVDHGPDVDDV